MYKVFTVVIVGLLSQCALASAAAPVSLKGKSIKLNWTDTWSLINVASNQPSSSPVKNDLVIYISSQGRVFSKRSIADRDGSSASAQIGNSGSNLEQLRKSNAAGQIQSFGNISFSGRTLTALRTTGSGNATRVVVAFDEAFSSCTLSVTHGQSSKKSIMLSPTSKMYFQVVGATSSGMTCSVVSENLFQ